MSNIQLVNITHEVLLVFDVFILKLISKDKTQWNVHLTVPVRPVGFVFRISDPPGILLIV